MRSSARSCSHGENSAAIRGIPRRIGQTSGICDFSFRQRVFNIIITSATARNVWIIFRAIRTFTGTLNQKKTALHDWLLSANATNMASMLSAQLAAMKLNVLHGNVSGTALVYAGSCGNTGVGGVFITINDLMNAAVSDPTYGLCADGNTLAGDPCRETQECWKTALDNANNNLNFVQSEPWPFSFNPPDCP